MFKGTTSQFSFQIYTAVPLPDGSQPAATRRENAMSLGTSKVQLVTSQTSWVLQTQ